MQIDNFETLKKAVLNQTDNLEVTGKAFEFCDDIHRAQVSGSGTDWSISASNGWMAIFTNFNHRIHRSFMKPEKRDREDVQHVITKNYIIRKTDSSTEYQLILRK